MCGKLNHLFVFFLFNDTATTEIYTLSLHDALPISLILRSDRALDPPAFRHRRRAPSRVWAFSSRQAFRRLRSEEHTSELQSRRDLVCRLLLEKKNNIKRSTTSSLQIYTQSSSTSHI